LDIELYYNKDVQAMGSKDWT